MGHVRVHGADVAQGRIERLRVQMPNLPARTIDRATALAWMKDGHSLLPVFGGSVQPALVLVEVGEDDQSFIRSDARAVAEDAVLALPPVDRAGI